MYAMLSLISMLPTLLCFGMTGWMVMNDHPGWGVAFFIAAIIIIPDIKWRYVTDKKESSK